MILVLYFAISINCETILLTCGGYTFSQNYVPSSYGYVLEILKRKMSYWGIEIIMKLYLGQSCIKSGLSITLS